MKKIILLLLIIIMFSCSTSTMENYISNILEECIDYYLLKEKKISGGDITQDAIIHIVNEQIYASSTPLNWKELDINYIVGNNKTVAILRIYNNDDIKTINHTFKPWLGDDNAVDQNNKTIVTTFPKSSEYAIILTNKNGVIALKCDEIVSYCKVYLEYYIN